MDAAGVALVLIGPGSVDQVSYDEPSSHRLSNASSILIFFY